MLPKRAGTATVILGAALVLALSTLPAAFAGSIGGSHRYQVSHESPRLDVAALASGTSPTCSGYTCDNKDPVQTGCSSTAYTASSAPLKYNGVTYGEVDNRYSTACATNWARTIGYGANGSALKFVWVCRTTGSRQGCSDVYSNTAQTIYSNQLYAPSPICAVAHGDIDLSYADATGSATAC